MLLLFDNYDSFTYNIYQLLASLGAEVEVVRNDAVTPEDVLTADYEAVILSPGPGLPKDAGNLELLIEAAKGKVPLLGICLGHQAIGEVFGGRIVRAKEIVHGKPSPIRHDGQGLYAGLPEKAAVGRYATTRSSSSANPCPTASPSPPSWKTARSWACATRSTPSRASSPIPSPS